MSLSGRTEGTRQASSFAWKGRSVFITGAAGFIGSWLSEQLVREGARITALVLPDDEETRWRPFIEFDGVDIVRGRVEDSLSIERILRDANTDTVFHLAAINTNIGTAVPPLEIFETNIRGTWSVLEACRLTPGVRRIVVASSREAEEVGKPQGFQPTRDSRRRHPYQVSKVSAELVTEVYSDTYQMPVAICRTDNVYGGRDLNWNRLIPGTIRLLLDGQAPTLRSDGTLSRDYVYVDDIVNAYMRLAARAAEAGVCGEVFHFATGSSTSVLEIVMHLCELVGRPDLKPVILNESRGERVDQQRSTTREQDLLGWTSRMAIRDGLLSTVDWYRSYLATGSASCSKRPRD